MAGGLWWGVSCLRDHGGSGAGGEELFFKKHGLPFWVSD